MGKNSIFMGLVALIGGILAIWFFTADRGEFRADKVVQEQRFQESKANFDAAFKKPVTTAPAPAPASQAAKPADQAPGLAPDNATKPLTKPLSQPASQSASQSLGQTQTQGDSMDEKFSKTWNDFDKDFKSF